MAIESARERARRLFPSVLLTVLGIVQALALELLWEDGPARMGAWREAGAELTGWLQHATIFLGIVVIWLVYATMVMRLRWTPSSFDLVMPFLVGLLQFVTIALMVPATAHWWFVVLGLIFALVSAVSFRAFRSASREDDAVASRTISTREWVSYVPSGVSFTVLMSMGVWVWATGPAATPALVGAALAVAFLAVQLGVLRFYWNRDVFRDESDAPADDG